MKKLIEVKKKTWGETSEGKYTKKCNLGLRGRSLSRGGEGGV